MNSSGCNQCLVLERNPSGAPFSGNLYEYRYSFRKFYLEQDTNPNFTLPHGGKMARLSLQSAVFVTHPAGGKDMEGTPCE